MSERHKAADDMDRNARLKAALRANLAKRKERDRAQEAATDGAKKGAPSD